MTWQVGTPRSHPPDQPTRVDPDSGEELVQVPGQRDRAVEIAPDVALDLREHRRRHGPEVRQDQPPLHARLGGALASHCFIDWMVLSQALESPLGIPRDSASKSTAP